MAGPTPDIIQILSRIPLFFKGLGAWDHVLFVGQFWGRNPNMDFHKNQQGLNEYSCKRAIWIGALQVLIGHLLYCTIRLNSSTLYTFLINFPMSHLRVINLPSFLVKGYMWRLRGEHNGVYLNLSSLWTRQVPFWIQTLDYFLPSSPSLLRLTWD